MKFKVLGQHNFGISMFCINFLKSLILILFLVSIPISAHAAKVSDFIPADCLVYVQLKDIDEIYNEIQISDDWEKIIDQVVDESDMQEIKQGLLLTQGAIGTDISEVIDTVGYQTGFALWKTGINTIHGGIVIHSGGNLAELQRFTKIVTGFVGMSEGTLKLNAGKYRKVKYNTLQLPDVLFTYGFVSDFLVIGIQENSFEKLIDTYRKKSPSIRKNTSYTKTSKKIGEGQLSVFADVSEVLELNEDIEPEARTQLQTFQNVYARLNLLEVEPLLQIHTDFNPNLPDNIISLFLKEGSELKTLNNVLGDEDLFIAIAPTLLKTGWQLLETEIEDNANDEAFAFITFLEGILNLDLEDDVMAGLTGELALSVSNLSRFDPEALESLDIQIDNTLQIDASNVNTSGGLIFVPSDPSKWDEIGNSFSNLQNTSVSHIDYKGTKVSMFASNIYYAEKDGLAFLSFSEDHIYAMIDKLQEKKKRAYLKQLPKSPLVVVKLNILKLLESINGVMPIEKGAVKPDDISPLLAWISVKENAAMFEVTLSEKDSPLEVLAKLAPFIVPHLKDY